jgi:hypothetical protein
MKKHIVERYSFVDTEADKRDHRPVMPKKVRTDDDDRLFKDTRL